MHHRLRSPWALLFSLGNFLPVCCILPIVLCFVQSGLGIHHGLRFGCTFPTEKDEDYDKDRNCCKAADHAADNRADGSGFLFSGAVERSRIDGEAIATPKLPEIGAVGSWWADDGSDKELLEFIVDAEVDLAEEGASELDDRLFGTRKAGCSECGLLGICGSLKAARGEMEGPVGCLLAVKFHPPVGRKDLDRPNISLLGTVTSNPSSSSNIISSSLAKSDVVWLKTKYSHVMPVVPLRIFIDGCVLLNVLTNLSCTSIGRTMAHTAGSRQAENGFVLSAVLPFLPVRLTLLIRICRGQGVPLSAKTV